MHRLLAPFKLASLQWYDDASIETVYEVSNSCASEPFVIVNGTVATSLFVSPMIVGRSAELPFVYFLGSATR